MYQAHRRLGYVFLCAMPFLAAALTVRALRVPGVYQAVGMVHFGAVCLSAWRLGLREVWAGNEGRRRLALAGALLLLPFALVSLLWVGIGTPWAATPVENRLRYLVLLTSSAAVAVGFVVLNEALREAGERLWSALGLATGLLGGAAYLVWTSLQLGAFVIKVQNGDAPSAFVSLSGVFDILLFVAGVLTYLATAAFAAALGRAGWLGRGATRAYVLASGIAFALLAARGLSFPDPTAGAAPWYTRPGFIAGIPAIPWILPALLGAVLLRRAGDEPA